MSVTTRIPLPSRGNRDGYTDITLQLFRISLFPRGIILPFCNVTQDVIGVAIDQTKADPQYIAAFLSSKIGRVQIIRWGQGNIQQHLNMPSVRQFVWVCPDRKVQTYIGDKVREVRRLRELIPCLTTASKLLVEALIEGNITEDELKTAQEALQRGDREPDQLILSRLTRKGFDVKGEPPLFPDLDTLYEAIYQLNADNEEEP